MMDSRVLNNLKYVTDLYPQSKFAQKYTQSDEKIGKGDNSVGL